MVFGSETGQYWLFRLPSVLGQATLRCYACAFDFTEPLARHRHFLQVDVGNVWHVNNFANMYLLFDNK